MKITKKFKFEGSHSVRDCSSKRCSHSVHGHSYICEIEFEGSKLDHAGMLIDFGLMKNTIGKYIDSLDHCHLIYKKDKSEYVEFFMKHNDRWIAIDFNPSAEMIAVWLLYMSQYILDHTIFKNGEGDVRVSSVTVHETATGRAQAFPEDVKNLYDPSWEAIYSNGVIEDWSNELVFIMNGEKIENPEPYRQTY